MFLRCIIYYVAIPSTATLFSSTAHSDDVFWYRRITKQDIVFTKIVARLATLRKCGTTIGALTTKNTMKTSIPNITINNEKVNNSTGKGKSNIHCSMGLCKSDTRYAEKFPIYVFCYTQKITINHSCMHMTRVRLIYLLLLQSDANSCIKNKFKLLTMTSCTRLCHDAAFVIEERPTPFLAKVPFL